MIEIFKLVALFIPGFLTSFLTTPFFIKRLTKRKHTARDMYKRGNPQKPTMGGIVILSGVLASLIFAQLLLPEVLNLLIFYFVIFLFAFFGLVDDLLSIKSNLVKVIFPFFLSLPISLLNFDTTLSLIFTEINLGVWYSLLIAPLYVTVVANLINMHSSYNGLSVGLSLILLCTIGVRSYLTYGYESLFYLLPILSSTLAFFFFNKYPSRIFEGNSGTYMLGAAIGGLLILLNMEIFGIIILIPHIVNFLMYVYLKIRKRKIIKFGKTDREGYLIVPHPMSLKWTLPYYFKMTEKQAIVAMYLLTLLFCLLGLTLM